MERNQQQQKYSQECNKGLPGHSTTHNDALLSIRNEDQDYISKLCDDTLIKITSFLPFKCALRTIILSTRWKNLWTLRFIKKKIEEQCRVRFQNIDDSLGVIEKFESYVDQELQNPQILQFQFHHGIFVLATINGEMKLKLDFSNGQNDLPFRYQHGIPIRYVDLWSLQLGRRDLFSTNVLYSVKSLYLKSVNRLTGDIVSNMIFRLHLLEHLTVVECSAIRNITVFGDRRLQSLKVFDCSQIRTISIFSYHITTFHYRGLLPNLSIKQGLTDVMLNVTNGEMVQDYDRIANFSDLRDSLQNVKTLTLCGWFFEISPMWWLGEVGRLVFEHRNFLFNQLKEIRWLDSPMNNKYKMEAMISFLKMSPNLERIFINIDPMCYRVPAELSWWKENANVREENVNRIPPRRLNRLKIIKLEGFTNREEILFLNRLLKEVLGGKVGRIKIIATSQKSGIRRLVKIRLNQRTLQGIGHRNPAGIIGDERCGYFYEFIQDDGRFVLPYPKHHDNSGF